MHRLAITWLGHSTFLVRTPGGRRLLFDPWLAGNPACPEPFRRPPQVDLILVSHGHGDHMEDAEACARASGAPVVAAYELCDWLARKGVAATVPMNRGGSYETGGLRISVTDARHSSAFFDGRQMVYMGEPCGFVVRLEDGLVVYFAGDTALFGDMRLIGEIHRPDLAFLPIGDRFTMGPDDAARACQLLGVRQVVPMHWGTFPILTGTPEALKASLAGSGVTVLELKPGETAE
jgi:L-ascorbate metabolism protein UlaG (beta-lactamase superfamily)